MGSEYKILKSRENDITAYEVSSRISISKSNKVIIPVLSPHEVVILCAKLLEVASYNLEDGQKEVMRVLKDNVYFREEFT